MPKRNRAREEDANSSVLAAAPLQLITLAPASSSSSSSSSAAPVRLFARLERGELLLLAAPTPAGPAAALLRSADALRARLPALERVVARGLLAAPAAAGGGAGAPDAPPYALLRLAGGRAAALAVLARPLALPAADAAGRAVGLRAWLAAHNAAAAGGDARALQAGADEAMAAFEAGEGAASRRRAELAARMQADGFTLVTRRSRVDEGGGDDEAAAEGGGVAAHGGGGGGGGGGSGGGGSFGGRESTNAKRKRRRGDLAVRDFYTENARERKGARLQALRAGFDEDRAKIARTKAARPGLRA
jgi:hypothetical protein